MAKAESVKSTGMYEQPVKVTKHGGHRLRDRMGLNKSSIEKNCKSAIEKGLARYETDGRLRKYLDYKFQGQQRNIRVYNRYIYIFDREYLLITVWPLPPNLYLIADKQQKRRAEEKELANKENPAESSENTG